MLGRVTQKTWSMLVYLFLFAPILAVTLMSFNASRFSKYPPTGYTLDWYVDAFEDPAIVQAILTSAFIAIVAASLATIIGTLAAVAISRYSFRLHEFFRATFMAPLIIPEVVIAVALLALSANLNLQGGLPIVIAGHVLIGLPFVLTVVSARLHGLGVDVEEAAMDLGANEVQTFFKVTLPLAMPGVIAGLVLAFTISFDNFLVTYMTAGSGTVTIPIKIYSMLRFEVSPKIHAASTIVIALTVALMLLYQFFSRESEEKTH
ncbi:ABC transporter permease [Polycladidibacter stylochi]|uniref:ABC transporter permease n=1 Tax=Polycladidibacter stylochi TaxID=1807766 RepID=UPI00082A6C27|nr:ABC transporter permease [Pseudovibrio stylochi]